MEVTPRMLSEYFREPNDPKLVLEELFGMPFYDHNAPEDITNKVLAEIFYGLYYGDIKLERYKGKFDLLLTQIYAEKGHIHIEGSPLRLIRFLFTHQREGTFALINAFDAEYAPLIDGLLRQFYDVAILREDLPLDKAVALLEEHALEEVHLFHKHFTSLVKNLSRNTEDIYKGLLEIAKEPKQLEIAKRTREIVRQGFAPYFSRTNTFEDYLKFCRTYGLKGYPSIYKDAFSETTSLIEKIKSLDMIVEGLIGIRRSIASLMPDELQSILSFVFAIIRHLVPYEDEELEGITVAIATCGKELSSQHALATCASAAKIIVYDQSDDALFEKNSAYIETLQGNFLHISKKSAVAIAKKIGAQKLLETTPDGSFGYGGGRNCQFLLTGLLQSYSVEELVSMSDGEVKRLFWESLTAYGVGKNFLIVDDDMFVSDTNIKSSAYFIRQYKAEPVGAVGYQLGRASKYNLFYWGLDTYLQAPEKTTMFPEWLDYQTLTGMSESIIKPKICLNLPQGNEENHYLSMAVGHYFLKPSYHLCGSRYPSKEFPTHFFVGMDEAIDKALNFVLLLYLTDYLISPKGRYTKTALPWNDNELSARIRNLQQGMQLIASQTELSGRFWQKVKELFCDQKAEYAGFLMVIDQITKLDVEATCQAFEEKNRLTANEKDSLVKLKNVYKRIQEDVALFWECGKMLGEAEDPVAMIEKVKEKIGNKSAPLTEGLYLMSHAIGAGEFVAIITNL